MSSDVGVVRLMRNRTSLLMVIPRPFQRTLKWVAGDRVTLSIEGNQLIVTGIESHLVAVAPRHRRSTPHVVKT